MDDQGNAIRQFLQELLQQKNDSEEFGDSDSLILSGRLQSIDVLEVALFLEQRYGIDFSGGFDQASLDSVDAIMALLHPS